MLQQDPCPLEWQLAAVNIMSTVYLMSSLEADTVYDVELVDIECLNIILNRLSVLTKMVPSK